MNNIFLENINTGIENQPFEKRTKKTYKFYKRLLSIIFYFHFELQKVQLNRDTAGKNLESFETSQLNSTATFSRSDGCDERTAVLFIRIFTMVAPQEICRSSARAMLCFELYAFKSM